MASCLQYILCTARYRMCVANACVCALIKQCCFTRVQANVFQANQRHSKQEKDTVKIAATPWETRMASYICPPCSALGPNHGDEHACKIHFGIDRICKILTPS